MIVNIRKGVFTGGLLLLYLVCAFRSAVPVESALNPRSFAVELTAEVKNEPAQIVLKWRGDEYARKYTINRKAREAKEWVRIGSAEGYEAWFVDMNVSRGSAYEYQVVKEGTLEYTGYGYIYAGIEVPVVENRGGIVLLVESSVAGPLEAELRRLEWDLMGDGWRVVRQDVPKTASVTDVRAMIRAIHASDPQNTHSLFLFGNVPVPYSGNLTPDEHDDHKGAWPADVYYGDLDGLWTDHSVTATGAARTTNHNYPGDGKFDQSEVPSTMELQVGRVDLSRMTCFQNKSPSRSEIDLLRVYLEKDHTFRHGRFATERRGLIYDRIGLTQPEPLGTMAWRNFAPFVGGNVDVIEWSEFFPKVAGTTYLWSSVSSGGSLVHSDGVGTSDAFALYNVNVVFGMFSGSYYGDWDNESNFLRAALGANGRILVSLYSGQPQWICHTMALGETIGAAAKLTQENNEAGIYVPHNRGAGQVHVSLLGDPTLRAHPVPSPGALQGTARDGGLELSWNRVEAPGVAGYFVYEADSVAGPFRRVTTEPITSTSYFAAQAGRQYMVRAIALTTAPSGSYWNLSQGVFYPDAAAGSEAVIPTAPRDLVVSEIGPAKITLRWVSSSFEHTAFEIERLDPGAGSFVKVGTVARDQFEYGDLGVTSNKRYSYRVRAVNGAGGSEYSNVALASTETAFAEFVGADRATQGWWIGRYGSLGYTLPNFPERLPSELSLTMSNVTTFATTMRDEVRALQVPGQTLRSVNIWNNFTPFAFNVNFSDDRVRQMALYVMSYSGIAEWLEIEVFDAVTRNLLDKRRVENILDGVYLIYNVSRQVIVRITPPEYRHGQVYGIFFDDPKIQPVQIEPQSGTFAGKMQVRMSTLSTQAEIRYTVDGSEPRENSARYDGPFWLYEDAHLRARAFRANYPPSEIMEANFINSLVNEVGLIGWDEESGGNWPGKGGKDGYWLAGGSKKLPSYLELSGIPAASWTWSDNTGDQRAPFSDDAGTRRVAAAWYDPEAIVIDLGVFETVRRAVSLYFLDWDQQQRVQQVEFLDAAGTVKDSYRIEDFGAGKYLKIGVKGYAKLRIKKLSGPNALLNGLFFDAAPVAVNVGAPVPFTNPVFANDTLTLTVSGTPIQRYCLDQSGNLRDWTCTSTNVILSPLFQLQVPARGKSILFLRGHIVP